MSSEADAGDRLIIEGINEDNVRFRPSDWVERISSLLATYGPDHRLHYSHAAHPGVINGCKCLVLAKGLRENNPQAYDFILKFARDNRLRVHEDHHVRSMTIDEAGHEEQADTAKRRA